MRPSAVLPTGVVEEQVNYRRMIHSRLNLTTLVNLMCHLLPERMLITDFGSWALLPLTAECLLVIIRKKTIA